MQSDLKVKVMFISDAATTFIHKFQAHFKCSLWFRIKKKKTT